MHHRPLTALRAFLLSLFLLGGPGLPLLDAVAFHGMGKPVAADTRLDTEGGARAHADICALAAPLPFPGPLPCGQLRVAVASEARGAATAPGAAIRLAPVPDASSRPRAPPVLSA
jgi:hypothetical protein